MQTNSFEALGHGEAARSTDTVMSLTRSGREAGSGSRHGADQGDQSTGCGHSCPVEPGSALPKSDRCRVSRNGYDCLNREQTGKISAKRRWLGADDGFAERIAVDDGCEMIEPDDRMSEPGQQPLHEGDGKLAAHHMVGQRRNWREYRSTRCKHAKFLEQGSIEQSLHRGPPSWWALCALDWCRFR